MSSRGRALVVVGSRQPATLHALAHALNAALGSVGATVTYAPVADPDEKLAGEDMKDLTDAIAAKKVDALVILGGNPVYDAPADLAFGEKLAGLFSVHASLFVDETSEKVTWHVPLAHEYESWGTPAPWTAPWPFASRSSRRSTAGAVRSSSSRSSRTFTSATGTASSERPAAA